MSEDLVNDIKNAVSVINDPHMGVSIIEMGIVQDIIVNDDKAKLIIKPTNPGCIRIAADAKTAAENVDGVNKVEVQVEGHAMADSINEMLNK